MTVYYAADHPVAVITVDRPEVSNAIDRPTALALADAMRRFDADPSLSVAVLTEAGLGLAREIAAYPQAAMRSDRMSSYQQWERTLPDALTREYQHGMATLHTGETFDGIRHFGAGERRFARIGTSEQQVQS